MHNKPRRPFKLRQKKAQDEWVKKFLIPFEYSVYFILFSISWCFISAMLIGAIDFYAEGSVYKGSLVVLAVILCFIGLFVFGHWVRVIMKREKLKNNLE
jgi:hypothetical protein